MYVRERNAILITLQICILKIVGYCVNLLSVRQGMVVRQVQMDLMLLSLSTDGQTDRQNS